MVATLAEQGVTGVFSVEAKHIHQFMKMGPPTFSGVKVKVGP